MKKRILSLLLTVSMVTALLAGCSTSSSDSSSDSDSSSTSDTADSGDEEQIVLQYWTWYPTVEQYQPTLDAFEAETGIKVEVTIMESTDYQTKIALALANGENVDLVGVQDVLSDAMVPFLEPVDSYLSEIDADWKSKFDSTAYTQCEQLSGDYDLCLLSCGSVADWFIYYNADMVAELGLEIPETFEDWAEFNEAIRDGVDDCIPFGFWGSQTQVYWSFPILFSGQYSSYYNEMAYDGASFDDPQWAIGLEAMYEMFNSVISYDEVGDLAKASILELFAAGQCASYHDGSWGASMLMEEYREENGYDFEVGVFTVPTYDEDGEASVRSYINQGIAVTNYSENKEAAMEFMYYMTCGEGSTSMGDDQYWFSTVVGYEPDLSAFTTDFAVENYYVIYDSFTESANVDRTSKFIGTALEQEIGALVVESIIAGDTDADALAAEMQDIYINY